MSEIKKSVQFDSNPASLCPVELHDPTRNGSSWFLDSAHFRRRIEKTETLLAPILQLHIKRQHRLISEQTTEWKNQKL